VRHRGAAKTSHGKQHKLKNYQMTKKYGAKIVTTTMRVCDGINFVTR
jgi:hypothetical protein